MNLCRFQDAEPPAESQSQAGWIAEPAEVFIFFRASYQNAVIIWPMGF